MYGVCKVCGCTDTNACVGGCYWVDAGHTLCSRCAHVSERVISKKRFEKETPGQHKHPRGEKTCSLCAKTFEGYGNNPEPFTGETCCDECNSKYVIPLRASDFLITKSTGYALLFTEEGDIELIQPKTSAYFTLEELQKAVGGLIELYPALFLNKLIICDEEGILKKRKQNRLFRKLTGIGLLGSVLLCPKAIFEKPEED